MAEPISTSELLQDIQDCRAEITKVRKAQDSTYGDKRLMRARLRELRQELKELVAEYKARTGSGGPSINIGLITRN